MSSINKYPKFDTLEILLEKEFEFKNYKPLRPVKAGHHISGFSFSKDFGRWGQFINGSEVFGPVLYNQLLSKPLVVAFYSHHWGNKGLEQLINLNNLQHQVKVNGGNLVIISPERPEALAKLAWEHSLSLNLYFDFNNQLAKQFGVYDEKSPVWNQFTGIDENVPLLATYVLSASKQVAYQHIDWNFENTFSRDEVLSSVYQAGNYKTTLKSA